MSAPDDLLAVAERALAKAARRADDAEIVLKDDETVATTLRGALSTSRSVSRTLVGARLRVGRRVGIASAALTDESVVDRVIEQALVAAGLGAEGEGDWGFAAGERRATPTFRADGPPEGAETARASATDLGARLRERAEYYTVSTGGMRTRTLVASTTGTMAADANELAWLTIEARVRERIPRAVIANRMGRAALSTDGFAEAVLEDLRRAQTVAPLAAGRRDVLLDAETASKTFPSLLVHLHAGILRQGVSRFAGKLGHDVMAPQVTLRDAADGAGLGARARALDDEGRPTRARDLVSKGRFVDALYSHEEARRAGVADAAGNGFRGKEGVDAPPKPGAVNLQLAPGTRSLAEMAASLGDGVLVRHELLGWYHSTSLSGLLSVVAPCAFLVQKGEVVSGLPPVTIGFDALAALAHPDVEVGADAEATAHGTSAPLLLRDVAVSA